MSKLSVKDSVVLELWENALFNDQALALIEKFSRTLKADQKFIREARDILTTIRNRNLISDQQQLDLQRQVVGVFGLSVGSHAAVTWIMESRAAVIKIADPDTISPTNLNRLRTAWQSVGLPKTEVVKAELKSIHPLLKVISDDHPNRKSMAKFFTQQPRLTAVVDAIDDFEDKIWLRQRCREHRIPLISAADVGDNVILDIERYDLDPQPPLFLGRLGDVEKIDFDNLSLMDRRKLIINLVGFAANSQTLLDSLYGIGKTLATWPQLGATATVAGGLVTTTLKKIFMGEKVKSGRFILSLDDLLVVDTNSPANQKLTAEKVAKVKTRFKL